MCPLTCLPVCVSSFLPALKRMLVSLPSDHHLTGPQSSEALFPQDDDLEEDDSDPEQSAASGFVVADGHLSDSEGFQDPEELNTELEGASCLTDDCTLP